MSKIDFTLYPNLNGQLGQNKVAIPDGVTTFWPDGDALVENFIYKDGKLVGLVDTKALIENDSKTTVLPYDYVDITLDKRLETLMTFNAGERCKHLNVKYDIFLPKGYKRLEYLESTGTQYIDTGIKLSNESEVKCEYEYDVEDPKGLFGCRYEYQHPQNYLYWGGARQPNVGLFFMGTAVTKGVPVNRKERIKVITNASGCYVNGVFDKLVSGVVGEFETTESTPLFCLKWLSGGNIIQQNFLGRVYAFSISRNNQLLFNLIPCLDDTGAPCMYDIISQEPFRNDGTGDFLYPGAESQVVTSDLDENFYAKKTEHGIQRLYKTPDDYSGTKDDYAIENGFKQLVEPPMPTDGYWTPQWIETDTQLICNWVEAEEPIV